MTQKRSKVQYCECDICCELEPKHVTNICGDRQQPSAHKLKTLNMARAGTHNHGRPQPLHSVLLRILTTACVSSPDKMGHLFQVAQGQCLCLIPTPPQTKPEAQSSSDMSAQRCFFTTSPLMRMWYMSLDTSAHCLPSTISARAW